MAEPLCFGNRKGNFDRDAEKCLDFYANVFTCG